MNTTPNTQISPMFTTEEACNYLRLTEYLDAKGAKRSLERLIDKKLIRPAMFQKHRMFHIEELNRFLKQRTKEYSDVRGDEL